MPFLPAHLIGHGWRDYLVYGGVGLGMAGGFWLFVSGRTARLRREQDADANDGLSELSATETLAPLDNKD